MNRKEELKNILDSFGVYSLIKSLKLDYDSLIKRQDYEDKITHHGLDVLSQNPEVKNHILSMVFPLDANGLMQSHELFIANGVKAYEKLLIVLEEEKEINKIFKISSNILTNKQEGWEKYRDRFVKFLAVVIEKSQSEKNVEQMFIDFSEAKKEDKTDYLPIIISFLNKGIPADKIFKSLISLNNSYLETRMIDYLYSKNIPFSFEIKQLDMYEEEEKIVIEKSFHFNTNYFMKLGISEEKVMKSLEKFADLICNTEEINYLVKNKSKKLSVILRSENAAKINKLYTDIKSNSHLIQEFVQGFDDSQEYEKRFKTYWYLNGQFTQKDNKSKPKI